MRSYCRIACKNLGKLIKNQFGMLLLLALVECICLVAILFTFGIYENYQCVKRDDIIASRNVQIDFGVDSQGMPAKKVSLGEVQPVWKEIEEILGGVMGSAQVCLVSADEKKELIGYRKYAQVGYDFLDTAPAGSLESGRDFTQEEAETGARVALTFREDIEEMEFDGVGFALVGRLKPYVEDYEDYMTHSYDFYYAPLNSLPESSKLNYIQITTTRILSEEMQKKIEDCLDDVAGGRYNITGTQVISAAGSEAGTGITVLAFAMAGIAAVNLIVIYGYLYEKRQLYQAVIRICGATRMALCMTSFLETSILSGFCVLVSLGVFAGVVEPLLEPYFLYFQDFFTKIVYARFVLIYLSVLLAAGFLIAVHYSRKEPLRMFQEVQ